MRNSLLFLFLIFILSYSVKAQSIMPLIDVQHYNFSISLSDQNDTIKGQATVKIKFLKDVTAFKLNLVKRNSSGKGMLVLRVTENGNNLTFIQDSDEVTINTSVKANSTHNYSITYEGIPADGLIISTNEYGHRTFFGDNWPNRAHNWLPCADYPADKATVDFDVTAPDHYQVVANGSKSSETMLPYNLKLTHWKETAELPTKVMVIGVADFAIDHPADVGNVPVYTYVFPENKDVGFKSYAVAKDILPYYIKNIGPYAYEKLANVQSKTIFGGMENASAIFYFEKSVTSKGIEELMAHEIAHQWFGDGASEKNFGHLWLSEGFATYMTDLYLENKYGSDTLRKRLNAARISVIKFERKRLTPVVDTAVKSNYMQLLNANSYEKGGWFLNMLRRKLGDDLFWKGIRSYYTKYNGSNANTDDLRLVMEQVSHQNLKQFFYQWLYVPGHPQLAISWKYDVIKKELQLIIIQKQANLYAFPLDIAVDGHIHHFNITGNNISEKISISKKPTAITPDPDVNLLATFDVTESN